MWIRDKVGGAEISWYKENFSERNVGVRRKVWGVCNECNLLSRIKIFLLMFLIYDMTSIYKQNIFLQTSSVHNQMIISTRVGTQQRLCTSRDLNCFSFPQRWVFRPTRHVQRTACRWSVLTTTCMNTTAPSTSQPSASSINTSSSELTGPSK